jgi:hypothetical protein
MIPYRPIAPLTAGPRKGWKSVLAAVVMASLLGTTAPSAMAAGPAPTAASATEAAQPGTTPATERPTE